MLVSDTILEPYKAVIQNSGKPLEMVSPDMTLHSERLVDMYVNGAVLFTGTGTHHEEHPSLEGMHKNGETEASDTVCFSTKHMRQGLRTCWDASLQVKSANSLTCQNMNASQPSGHGMKRVYSRLLHLRTHNAQST